MIDAIYLALSGMLGHERGLNVIGNNVSNMNTAGFRGSTVSFADVFIGTAPNGLGANVRAGWSSVGGGVDASRSQLDFRSGQTQTTGGDLDLALDGTGYFIVQDANGDIRYTRAGAFEIVDDELRVRGQTLKVMTRDVGGRLVPVSIKALRLNPARPTTTISFRGNLSPSDPNHTIDSLAIFDADGGKHTLSLSFTRQSTPTTPDVSTSWQVSVKEGESEIGTTTIDFRSSNPANPLLHATLTPANAAPIDLTFDLIGISGTDFGASVNSDLQVEKQDGFASGTITGQTFDAKGVLKLSYSNGQTADGPRLTLAQIADENGLVQLGDGLFDYRGGQGVTLREAGDDLQVKSGTLEGSNVDLTQQFGQLILMQRGYQASSQVMSTANEMLQQLFDLGGRR